MAKKKTNSKEVEEIVEAGKGIRNAKKCFIYTRVSTTKQVEEGYSLEAQEGILRKAAKGFSIKVVDVFSDEGKSGKNASERPQFQRMFETIKANPSVVDYIIVYKLSRFGRNTADILNYIQLLDKYDIGLYIYDRNLDSKDLNSRLFITLLGMLSEVERENILEQTMIGRKQKALEGKWNGGIPPYGYIIKDSRLVIDKETSIVVKDAFEKYTLSKWSYHRIAEYLNITYKRQKTMYNSKSDFTARWVRRILSYQTYCGDIVFQGKIIKNTHEAIISRDIWNLANERRRDEEENNSKVYTNTTGHTYLLSGIIECPVCHKPLSGSSSGGNNENRFYYLCKHHHKEPGKEAERCKFNRSINEKPVLEQLEKVILNCVDNTAFEERIKANIGSSADIKKYEKRKEEINKEIKALEKKREDTRKKIMCLDEEDQAFEMKNEDLTKTQNELYKTIIDKNNKLSEIDTQIISIKNAKLSEKDIYNALKQFKKKYKKMGADEKKEYIRLVIRKVTINPAAFYKPKKANYSQILDTVTFAVKGMNVEIDSADNLDDEPSISIRGRPPEISTSTFTVKLSIPVNPRLFILENIKCTPLNRGGAKQTAPAVI